VGISNTHFIPTKITLEINKKALYENVKVRWIFIFHLILKIDTQSLRLPAYLFGGMKTF